MLYGFLVRPQRDTTSEGRITDESRPLRPLAGKTVGKITIARQPVFRPDGGWLQRTGNKLHRQTRERVLRRDLLFRPGDAFDPELVVRTEQLLRTRDYIADADIDVRLDPVDTTCVELIVRTRDSWSISGDGAWRSRGRTMVALEDANILGYGTLLRLKTHFDRRDFTYGGNIVEYIAPNLFGSFFSARFSAGRAFYASELVAELRKEFLRPTDYGVGALYSRTKSKRYIIDRDTSLPVRIRELDLWCGRSRHLPSIRSSLFLTVRFDRTRFDRRPPVAKRLHPALHERDLLLLAAGLYRERFYTANMVYGFGTKEYLATGYRLEATGGHAWGEFGNEAYLGIGFRTGGFRRAGYLMGAFSVGGFIDPANGAWHRNAADVDLQWFSNLLMVRRTRLRQFFGINYTHGWNRASGPTSTSTSPTKTACRPSTNTPSARPGRCSTPKRSSSPLPAPRLPHRPVRIRRFRHDRRLAQPLPQRLLLHARARHPHPQRTADFQHDPAPLRHRPRQARRGGQRLLPPVEHHADGPRPLPPLAPRYRGVRMTRTGGGPAAIRLQRLRANAAQHGNTEAPATLTTGSAPSHTARHPRARKTGAALQRPRHT